MSTQRFVEDGVLSDAACEELCFIQTSLAVRGYRPHVTSVTLHDLVAAEPAFIMPVVEARRRIWEATEKALGRELELHPEFTGLLSWHPGAAIGWHHDANRPYLKQRQVAAVAYLNTQSVHFTGGSFLFQSPEPTPPTAASQVEQMHPTSPARVTPVMGRLIGYTAGAANVHCVEAVEAGCRHTLVMWFTTDPAFREDDSVLRALLAACHVPRPTALHGGSLADSSHEDGVVLGGGLPDTMYLDEHGVDKRVAFLEQQGLLVCEGTSIAPSGCRDETTGGDGRHGRCSTMLPQRGVVLRCKRKQCKEKLCSQEAPQFSSLTHAMQTACFLLWQQDMLLLPLAAVESVPPAQQSGGNGSASRQAMPRLQSTCSRLPQAVADLLQYKRQLCSMLANAANAWGIAGYLGA